MRIDQAGFFLYLSLSLATAAYIKGDFGSGDLEHELALLDPYGTLDEEDFLNAFHLPNILDAVEKNKRSAALKQHQLDVLEANKMFLNGTQTWSARTYSFSDLPDDEFRASHTGLVERLTEGPDEESEKFFAQYKLNRASVPASYNSVELGYVSPVKDQGNCGSCVGFATLALVETCFKKSLGKFGDYSEQHLLDCAFNGDTVNGCQGASPQGYAKWLKEKDPKLASEKNYPYVAKKQTCRSDYTPFNQGRK